MYSPNYRWLSDITEIQIPAGKVYLPTMTDCFDGMVVSWIIDSGPDSDLVNMSLDAAIERVAGNAIKPVIQSDRGAHYRWPSWLSRVHNGKQLRQDCFSTGRRVVQRDGSASALRSFLLA